MFIGACGLVIVQVVPFFFNGVFGANVSFGGTSLIIIVGVVLETIKKIESQMLVRNYSGFLSSKAHQSKRVLGYEMRQFSSLYAVPFGTEYGGLKCYMEGYCYEDYYVGCSWSRKRNTG